MENLNETNICNIIFYALSENRNRNFEKFTIKKIRSFKNIDFLSITEENKKCVNSYTSIEFNMIHAGKYDTILLFTFDQ